MVKNYKISEPFFEYGPKCYMYGETLLNYLKNMALMLSLMFRIPKSATLQKTQSASMFILSIWIAFPLARAWAEP